jgi:hypothetical protein
MLSSFCLMTAIIFYSLTSFAPLVHADAASDARKAIIAIYSNIEVGVINCDLQPLVDAMAPDYVQVGRAGQEQPRMTPE